MSKKLALLIGANYKDSDYPLNGCINDIKIMRKYLIEVRNYDKNNITILRDDLENFIQPTRDNIVNNLINLINEANNPINNVTEVFLHFSGHGNNDLGSGDTLNIIGEVDKKNEYIFTSDSNIIVDNEIRDILKNLSDTITMYIVMDCCRSGTNIDLPFVYDVKNSKLRRIQNTSSVISDYINKNIYSISGCTDKETSSDGGKYLPFNDPEDINFSITPNNTYGGLLTAELLKLLRSNSGFTFLNCLRRLRVNIKKYDNKIGDKKIQQPLLSTSMPVKVNLKK